MLGTSLLRTYLVEQLLRVYDLSKFEGILSVRGKICKIVQVENDISELNQLG